MEYWNTGFLETSCFVSFEIVFFQLFHHSIIPMFQNHKLGSFEEVYTVPFSQGDNGLLPVGPLSISLSQTLHFAQNSNGPDIIDLHLEEVFNGRLDFDLIRIPIDLEDILMSLIFLEGALFSYQRSSDNLLRLFHDANTPSIFSTAGLNKIRCL